MNRDDVIRMAREADIIDFRDASDDPHVAQMVDFLMRFSALVAAAEREECARVVDAKEKSIYLWTNTTYLIECAAAIRARGVQPKD